MTIPCEQFEDQPDARYKRLWKREVPDRCARCSCTERDHDLAAAIRAEHDAAGKAIALAESFKNDAERAEAQASTLTARVQALVEQAADIEWQVIGFRIDALTCMACSRTQEQGHHAACALGALFANVRALLTQEPTP